MSNSKQETCLCKACENFTCYEKVLGEVVDTIEKELLHGCEDEGELPDDEQDPVLGNQCFKSLKEFVELKRRIDKVSTAGCWCAVSRAVAASTATAASSLVCLVDDARLAICFVTVLLMLARWVASTQAAARLMRSVASVASRLCGVEGCARSSSLLPVTCYLV